MCQCHDIYEPARYESTGWRHAERADEVITQCHDAYPPAECERSAEEAETEAPQVREVARV